MFNLFCTHSLPRLGLHYGKIPLLFLPYKYGDRYGDLNKKDSPIKLFVLATGYGPVLVQ